MTDGLLQRCAQGPGPQDWQGWGVTPPVVQREGEAIWTQGQGQMHKEAWGKDTVSLWLAWGKRQAAKMNAIPDLPSMALFHRKSEDSIEGTQQDKTSCGSRGGMDGQMESSEQEATCKWRGDLQMLPKAKGTKGPVLCHGG